MLYIYSLSTFGQSNRGFPCLKEHDWILKNTQHLHSSYKEKAVYKLVVTGAWRLVPYIEESNRTAESLVRVHFTVTESGDSPTVFPGYDMSQQAEVH